MATVKGTWKDGQIILDEAVDWPDGARVVVVSLPVEETVGIREDDWPETAEARAEWLRWYESLEPLEITHEEEADLAAWRERVKDYTLARTDERVERLFK